MQPNLDFRKGVINSTSNLSSTHQKDQLPGFVTIKDENGNLAVDPIPLNKVYAIEKKASQAEKVQWVVIATDAETIVANTRYSVSVEFPKDRVGDSSTRDTKIFAYSTGTLSGTAATDRANVYNAIKAKINAYVKMYTSAKTAVLFTFKGAATVTTTGFAAGDKWYVGASLAAATWVGFVVKATGTLANATGQKVLLVTESGTFPTAPTTDVFKAAADDAVQSVADAASTYTADQALVLYDQGGYYSYKEKLGRGGAPYIKSSATFTAARPVVIQAAQEGHGIGSLMLAKLPEFDLTRQNVDRGDYQAQFTQLPETASTYSLYIIKFMGNTPPNAIDGSVAQIPCEVQLYVKESAGAVDATFNTKLTTLANYQG